MEDPGPGTGGAAIQRPLNAVLAGTGKEVYCPAGCWQSTLSNPNQRFEARTISFQPLDPADAQAYTTSDDAADCADDHHRPGGEFGIHK